MPIFLFNMSANVSILGIRRHTDPLGGVHSDREAVDSGPVPAHLWQRPLDSLVMHQPDRLHRGLDDLCFHHPRPAMHPS